MLRSRLLELSLDELNKLSTEGTWTLGDFVTAACLLEAAAPKAGNVHPTASFEDMNYEDFRQSARIIGTVFDSTDKEEVGSLILELVQATRNDVGKNTNLGIILLLVPLAISLKAITTRRTLVPRLQPGNALPGGSCLPSHMTSKHVLQAGASNPSGSQAEAWEPNGGVQQEASDFLDGWKNTLATILKSLTENDSIAVYEAIAIAKPGGIHSVSEMDIQDKPPSRLLDAMQLAAKWDDIAKQYTTDFSDIFDLSLQLDKCRKHLGQGWFDALVSIQVERLASHGDTLIARKNDAATNKQVQHLAQSSYLSQSSHLSPRGELQPPSPASPPLTSHPAWQQLDTYLRADGHRRNPGTTADLLAAATFVSLLVEYNTR